jgi:hypothetical protein
MAHDVFICHSSKDKPIIDAVCSALEVEKIRCWVAPRDIKPGQTWAEAITEAISNTKIMLLIFSSNSNNSKDVIKGLTLAVNSEVLIIPFRIEFVEPNKAMQYYLSDVHWLDAINPPTKNQINELVIRVKQIIDINKDVRSKEVSETKEIIKKGNNTGVSYKSLQKIKTKRIYEAFITTKTIKAIQKWVYYNIFISTFLYLMFFLDIYLKDLALATGALSEYYDAKKLYLVAFLFLLALTIIIIMFLFSLKGIKLKQEYSITLIRLLLIVPVIELIFFYGRGTLWSTWIVLGIAFASFIVRIVLIFYFWPKLRYQFEEQSYNPKIKIQILRHINKGFTTLVVALMVISIIILYLGFYLEGRAFWAGQERTKEQLTSAMEMIEETEEVVSENSTQEVSTTDNLIEANSEETIIIYTDGSWNNASESGFYINPYDPREIIFDTSAKWIWTPGSSFADVNKTFTIDGSIENAYIAVTADNYYRLYVNGTELGSNTEPELVFAQVYNIKNYLYQGKMEP